MFKRYAYWEKASTGWALTVYHDDKPDKSVNGQGPERIGPYEVPQELLGIDGTPVFGLIEKAFPRPAPVAYDEPPVVLNQEEKGLHLDPAAYDSTAYYEEPLPDWAKERAPEGKLSPMQQLYTRDGKARGNATLAAIDEEADRYLVVTDANNWITYSQSELLWAYEPGMFVLKEFPNPKSTEDWNVSQRQTEG